MNSPPDFTAAAIKMIIALVVLLSGLVAALYALKRILKINTAGKSGASIEILAGKYIGVKKSISLVRVPGCILVLGITKDNINLLTRINDPEILKQFEDDGDALD